MTSCHWPQPLHDRVVLLKVPTNSAGKPRNSFSCFFTYTRWSNDYSKLVRIIKLCCSLLSARYRWDRLKAEVKKMNKFKNTLWLLWLKTVLLCLIRIIHSTPLPPAYIKFRRIWVNCKLLWCFSLATSQVKAIKLYKLLNTAEKLKHNHRKKPFNWCN